MPKWTFDFKFQGSPQIYPMLKSGGQSPPSGEMKFMLTTKTSFLYFKKINMKFRENIFKKITTTVNLVYRPRDISSVFNATMEIFFPSDTTNQHKLCSFCMQLFQLNVLYFLDQNHSPIMHYKGTRLATYINILPFFRYFLFILMFVLKKSFFCLYIFQDVCNHPTR